MSDPFVQVCVYTCDYMQPLRHWTLSKIGIIEVEIILVK